MAASLHLEVENGGIIEPADTATIEEMKAIDQEIEAAEAEIAKQHIKALKPIYEKRREIFKKIPKFWSQVLMKRDYIGQYFVTDDYTVVQYIDDVIVERDESSLESFKVILKFSENEFFKNKELIKEFIVDADGQRKIKNTPVEWLEGRDYTKKRKVDDDDDQSFIKWFSEESSDEAWEVGKGFKDDIYPQAWTIYTEEEDDDDDEEVEADFEDDEEEEELEEPSKKRVKHN